jgi:hypothetical protein
MTEGELRNVDMQVISVDHSSLKFVKERRRNTQWLSVLPTPWNCMRSFKNIDLLIPFPEIMITISRHAQSIRNF